MVISIGILKVVIGMVAFATFILLLLNALKMVREVRPNTRLFKDLYGSTFNVYSDGYYLTPVP